MIVPNHWKEAKRIGELFVEDVKNKIVLDDFLSWNHYKKHEFFLFEKNKIYIVLRHTKKWLAQSVDCVNDDAQIMINVDDEHIEDENKNKTPENFYKLLYNVVCHELIHYFQRILKLEDNLSEDEKRKLYLQGNGFNSNRNLFLYATNWNEMDAELGSYFIQHDFVEPTLKDLIVYFREWYHGIELSTMIATYVYNYFISGKKNVTYRNEIFDRKKFLPFAKKHKTH